MKKILALAARVICLSEAEKTNRTNFTGTWALDPSNSSFEGQPPGQAPGTVTISQDDSGLKLDPDDWEPGFADTTTIS